MVLPNQFALKKISFEFSYYSPSSKFPSELFSQMASLCRIRDMNGFLADQEVFDRVTIEAVVGDKGVIFRVDFELLLLGLGSTILEKWWGHCRGELFFG